MNQKTVEHKITAWVRKVVRSVLPQGWFARNVVVLAGGTVLGQAIVVLTSPILTRLYTPEDFGVLAVYTSILSIISVIASLRYELAIPLPEKDEDAANILALSLSIVAFMGLLVGIGTWLLGIQIVCLANVPALRQYLWLFPVGVVMVGTYEVLNYWAVRKEAFTQIARTKLNQGAGLAIAQIGLGLLKSGPLGLLIGRIMGQAAGITTLTMLAYKKDKKALEAISPSRVRYMVARYRRFPLFSSGAALINALGLQLPVLLLSGFYGAQVVGQFMLVQRVFGLPLTLLGTAVSQVYLSQAAHKARADIQGLQKLFYTIAKRMAVLGSMPTIILVGAGPSLFSLVFGIEWRQAGVYAQIMAAMFLSAFVATPLSYTFSVLERQDLSLIWNGSRLLLSAGSIYIAYKLGWNATHAVVAYSIGMLVGYLSLFLLSASAIRSKTKREEAQ